MKTRFVAAWILVQFSLTAGAAFGQNVLWKYMNGTANDIGVGANGAVWIIGSDKEGGGYGIYRWQDNDWQKVAGGAVRLDVDPQGNPWIVNEGGIISRFDGTTWVRMPGLARDIGIGANGAVWIIGREREGGGFAIYRWQDGVWQKIPGGAVGIDVDPQGSPWIVNDGGVISRLVRGSWVRMPGLARDIGIGADGSAYIVGVDKLLYKWSGGNWVKQDTGQFRGISVGPRGEPWALDTGGRIVCADAPGK